MPLAPGTRLGPYEIVAPLGAGGMGEVFRATDTRLGREVAVKVLPQHLSDNPEVRARFEREAKTVSSLNHPHICVLHDVGREGDTDYLVMELVEGETLAERLEKGALPAAEVLRLGGQIADALDRAHRAGVIHRDLKPGNVMLTKSGAKLMDFGLARATGLGGGTGSGSRLAAMTQSPTVASPLTAEGTIVGTFQYMAPEQLEGKEADPRSDLWALGCVLYEMATGQPAFTGRSQATLISAIMSSEPPAVPTLAPTNPPHVDRLVRACLAKDPDLRWQSAADAAIALSWPTGEAASGSLPAPSGPVERQFLLTATHVRQLADRNPKLVGHPVFFLDNQVPSDRLVIYLHGIGGDGSHFEHVLQNAAERSVAVTLPGFAIHERNRPALAFEDHSQILRFFVRELVDECRPAKLVLVGYSAGADQYLRMVHDEPGTGVPVDALVALGPNVSVETNFVSRHVAQIDPTKPETTLATLKAITAGIDSLETMLVVQDYLSQTFLKLGPDTETLRRYATDLIAPFEGAGDPLAAWYRAARRKIPRVRLVFSREEAVPAEALLARHLEGNVLGDAFTEDSFLIEPCSHVALIHNEIVGRHVGWALAGPGL